MRDRITAKTIDAPQNGEPRPSGLSGYRSLILASLALVNFSLPAFGSANVRSVGGISEGGPRIDLIGKGYLTGQATIDPELELILDKFAKSVMDRTLTSIRYEQINAMGLDRSDPGILKGALIAKKNADEKEQELNPETVAALRKEFESANMQKVDSLNTLIAQKMPSDFTLDDIKAHLGIPGASDNLVEIWQLRIKREMLAARVALIRKSHN